MKKTLFVMAVALAAMSTAAQSAKNVFTGKISDSQCATNVHSKTQSHKEMTSNHTMGDTDAECVRTCVKEMGGSYVLLTNDGKVYRLSDQQAADKFAGESVKVSGTVNKAGTILVEKIEKTS